MGVRAIVAASAMLVGLLAMPVVAQAAPIGSTIDGRYAAIGDVAAGGQLDVDVLGRGAVPKTGVAAVELNVTATEATASSFVSVWPTGQPRSASSTLNFVAGQTTANVTVVGVGANGQVSLFNYAGNVHLVVDVIGWVPVDGPLHALPPARLADTRPGYPTTDGQAAGSGLLAGNSTRVIQVAGRGGVPAQGATAVVLNLTATNPSAPGYLSITPAGVPRTISSLSSNLNFVAGQTVANMVTVPLSASGQIDVYNYAGSTDVVVDVLGFSVDANGTNFIPSRVMDTRPGVPTNDGREAGGGPLGSGAVHDLIVAGRVHVPADAAAVAVNITATDPTADSYLTVRPTGAAQPSTSNLNFTPGDTVASTAIVALGTNGQLSIANYAGSTDVVVDVLGWFAADGAFVGLVPARLVDTRPVPTAPPAGGGGTPPSAPQNCAWQLSTEYQEGAGGQLFTWLDLTNTSSHACDTPHISGVVGQTTGGSSVIGTEQGGFGTPSTGQVGKGAHLQIVVSGPTNSDGCGLPADPVNTLAIDIGTTLTINLPRQPDGACGQLAYTQPLRP